MPSLMSFVFLNWELLLGGALLASVGLNVLTPTQAIVALLTVLLLSRRGERRRRLAARWYADWLEWGFDRREFDVATKTAQRTLFGPEAKTKVVLRYDLRDSYDPPSWEWRLWPTDQESAKGFSSSDEAGTTDSDDVRKRLRDELARASGAPEGWLPLDERTQAALVRTYERFVDEVPSPIAEAIERAAAEEAPRRGVSKFKFRPGKW